MAEEKDLKRGEKGYLKRFVNSFQEEADTALNDFKGKENEHFSEISKYKSELVREIESLRKQIVNLENKESELDKKIEQVQDFHSTIFEGDENESIISEEIEGFVEEFKEYRKEIFELKEDIDEYKRELFGYENDKGEEIAGFDSKIESLKNQLQKKIQESQIELDNFYTTNDKRQEELFHKIESLLKGASTVALAKAFKEHKDSFNISNYIWMGAFILSIVSMMVLSVWGFVNANYEFKDMWKYTLGNLPFIGGAVWLAIYSSKQRSQNKRLQQEYAYKEDVAKIYYGLKQEVEELGDTELGKKLNESVLKLVIDAVSLNPSGSLESSTHNEKGPILDSIKSLTESIKNIKPN